MKTFRVIFVSLIAVGVCGLVYIGLAAGLATYARYQAAPLETQAESLPTPTNADALADRVAASKPSVDANGMEDAASVLRRRWTAPRAGLTTPPPLAPTPVEGRSVLVPVASASWHGPRSAAVPPAMLTKSVAGLRELRVDPGSLTEQPLLDSELVLADRAIALPSTPPVRSAGPDADRVLVADVATMREADRPAFSSDPGAAAGEKLLIARQVKPRATPTAFDKPAIPEPEPYSAGPLRTEVTDPEAPMAPPDLPEPVKLPVK